MDSLVETALQAPGKQNPEKYNAGHCGWLTQVSLK